MFRTGIPLPKAPAGSFSEGMEQANKLTKGFVDTAMEPYTKQANALSKMAYAQLMGPQFAAKLMGNPDVLANMPNPQSAIRDTTNVALGRGGAGVGGAQPSIAENVVNAVRSLFGGHPTQGSQPQGSQQQRGQPQSANALRGTPGQGADSGMSYDAQGNNIVASPQEVDQAAYGTQPQTDGFSPETQTVAERSGKFKGIKEEGAEAGKIRAQSIKELDDEYGSALSAEKPLNELIDTTQDPVFKNMRSEFPFFQDKQLHVISKLGTPEQQRKVGKFISSAKNLVSETAKGFGGRLMEKEFDLADQMKVSDNDTWNTMMGKLESIVPLNQMTKQRTRIAADLMKNEHISKGEALERADKQIDGQKIRDQVKSRLNPKPTDDDINHMAKKYNISTDEVRKRLKQKGLL